MICRKCGSAVDNDAKFCPECGHKIGSQLWNRFLTHFNCKVKNASFKNIVLIIIALELAVLVILGMNISTQIEKSNDKITQIENMQKTGRSARGSYTRAR